MKEERKKKIATSFPAKFEERSIKIKLSKEEFAFFEEGIFALSMEEKWNIFTFNEQLYFARSWTDYCIYKIQYKRIENDTILKTVAVSRNSEEYKSTDINFDLEMFQKLLKLYLQRIKKL